MCAILADQHSDAFSGKPDTRAFRTYLENPVAIPLRRSKNVKTTVIRTSTVAPTERDEEVISCPPDTEVGGSKHKVYPYHKERFTEHSDVNNVYAGRGW